MDSVGNISAMPGIRFVDSGVSLAAMLGLLVRDSDLEDIARDSIRDMHVVGMDYICLHRSEQLTVKLYFFDDALTDGEGLVMPHDHRYSFATTVLRGRFTDTSFHRCGGLAPGAEHYHRCEFRSKMAGYLDSGFSVIDEADYLRVSERVTMTPGDGTLVRDATDIHTISIEEPGTVLCLLQGADTRDHPTSSWVLSGEKPPVVGADLYRRFSPGRVAERLSDIGLL